MNGIKGNNTAKTGETDIPDTGPALRIVTQDGRDPFSKNIPVTNRTNHDRKDITSMSNSTSPSPETGNTGNGPTFK